jgi:hypothetical protein
MRTASPRRAAQLRQYTELRMQFLALFPVCQVELNEARLAGRSTKGLQKSTEIHHVRGPHGEMLNDDRYWLAVCRKSHERIHRNPKWARKRGYIQPSRNPTPGQSPEKNTPRGTS